MLEWLVPAGLGVLLLNGMMYLQQPRMIFFPWQALDATPADWGLAYEDVHLVAEDGVTLHGWHIPHPTAQSTVLFLHGNAGNISHRRESLEIFHRIGTNVLIIDYRGYGRSAGSPSEAGLYLDATAAWRHLTDERGLDPQDIVLFGRSLGGAVAAHLAAEVTAGGVICESTFSSARDFARRVFPLLSRLVVLRFAFDAAGAIARTRSPVLVLHSPNDEIMPIALGQRLFDAAPEPKRFVTLRGDHNTGFLSSQPDYERALADFIRATRSPPP